jgi:uncharacterized protein (DUF488 family)
MSQTVYTVGHSRHTWDCFARLLALHGITAMCDVRSKPYSRLQPQFNREALKMALPECGITYLFLGKELGARSEDPGCYEGGQLRYARLAQTKLFQKGLERLRDGMNKGFTVALMCAEKEPLECHRTILVARQLSEVGIDVQHIHADGTLESHSAALRRLAGLVGVPENDLFRSAEELQADAYHRQERRIAFEREPAVAAANAAG